MPWGGQWPDATGIGVLVLLIGVCLVAVPVLRLRRRNRAPVTVHEAPVAQAAPDRPWAAVVANPTKILDADTELAWLEDRFDEMGWAPPVWLETTLDDPGPGQARAAVQAGAHTVIAYGGDGTVRAVASELAGRGGGLAVDAGGSGGSRGRG